MGPLYRLQKCSFLKDAKVISIKPFVSYILAYQRNCKFAVAEFYEAFLWEWGEKGELLKIKAKILRINKKVLMIRSN